jgi:hypothetical protein
MGSFIFQYFPFSFIGLCIAEPYFHYSHQNRMEIRFIIIFLYLLSSKNPEKRSDVLRSCLSVESNTRGGTASDRGWISLILS